MLPFDRAGIADKRLNVERAAYVPKRASIRECMANRILASVSLAKEPIGWLTLRIGDTRSRRLSDSTIRGVGDSLYHWCGESTTLRIIDTESFLLKKFKAS
jgi:hypothetical protein